MDLDPLFEKAKTSGLGMKKLNFILGRGIPFNLPHKIRIQHIDNNSAEVSLPYIKKNLNHLKGLHACALATVSEYTTGITLMSALGFKTYRIIMKSMKMEYHYQGKSDAIAKFQLSPDELKSKIQEPLEKEGQVLYTAVVKTYDVENNHLSTGYIEWQMKSWKAVSTKV